ncbi:hypothetical protein [Magnetococcus sp. PR-3]|uniref:hypothetical protein n=1 Tax=Magnetococcus sp. PR-3 TaxID=3120355 RepID=UPI002FCE5BA9
MAEEVIGKVENLAKQRSAPCPTKQSRKQLLMICVPLINPYTQPVAIPGKGGCMLIAPS